MRRIVITATLAAALVAGCAQESSPDPARGPGPAATVSSSTPPAGPVDGRYRISLEVSYEDWFRVPGSGVQPREMTVDYSVGPVILAVGEAIAVDADGAVSWTVRCYEGLPAFDAPLVWTESGDEPVDFGLTEAALSSIRRPDPMAQWLSGPAVGVLDVAGEPVLVHRVPAGHELGRPLPECDGVVRSMLVFAAGAGALTQPSVTTSTSDGAVSLASILASEQPAPYVDGVGEASGWVVHRLDDPGAATVSFERESIDEMGGYRLRVTGAVTPVG